VVTLGNDHVSRQGFAKSRIFQDRPSREKRLFSVIPKDRRFIFSSEVGGEVPLKQL